MPTQIRGILAVLAGILTGVLVIAAVGRLSPYHAPEGVGPENLGAYNRWVSELPTQAYLYVLASYLSGAFAAGGVTGWIARPTRYYFAPLIAGFILLIVGIGQFLAFSHPEWLTYSACIGFMVFAWLGGRLVRR